MRRLSTLALVACALGGRARALETEVELGVGVAGHALLGDVWFVSPLFSLGVPMSENVDMTITLGFTIATATGDPEGFDTSRAVVGSPMLAFPWRLGEGLVFAPGITVPLSRLPTADEPGHLIAAAAVNGGRGIRGRVDEWLWLPDELGFVFPLHWSKWLDPVVLELDLALAYVIPTSDTDPDDDFLLQMVWRVALRLTPEVWIGARFAAAYIPTNTTDNAQLSVAPEARWIFARAGGHVSVRFHVNLDTPYGPSFEAGRLWGLHLGTGWSL
ncbi:MAG: hypothetical protein IT385_07165 [Deltaproteobacteria bacterium]|nr:hypothetical protein [Deltaproteobacteria bacterium]